eukprot:tig00020616_g12283.t1
MPIASRAAPVVIVGSGGAVGKIYPALAVDLHSPSRRQCVVKWFTFLEQCAPYLYPLPFPLPTHPPPSSSSNEEHVARAAAMHGPYPGGSQPPLHPQGERNSAPPPPALTRPRAPPGPQLLGSFVWLVTPAPARAAPCAYPRS